MKKMLLGLALIGVIGLTACSGNNGVAEAKGESNIKLYTETINWDFHTYEIVDEDTGVHYLIAKDAEGLAITPMYVPNGVLKVSK